MISEFDDGGGPLPRGGMTSIQATELLKKEFQQIADWTCWIPKTYHRAALRGFVGDVNKGSGRVGRWSWKRIPCNYPHPTYWYGDPVAPKGGTHWVGAVQIETAEGESLILFSYLDSMGEIGRRYFASTTDQELLHRFVEDLQQQLFPELKGKILVETHTGRDLWLDAQEDNEIVLPKALQQDIEEQVSAFFQGREAFQRMRLRYRRGFLFVGQPGTGKTMMLRRLIRLCHRRYRARAFMLGIRRDTTTSDVAMLLEHAASQAPSLAILEDLDSLTKECSIPRAALLAQLDGLVTTQGVLILATTNNPREVDPALLHRPSRFDRVWHFPLPDLDLRLSYLSHAFETLDDAALESLAKRTDGWSFAYLNELRATAGILAINQQAESLTEPLAEEAWGLLSAQFDAGKKNHIEAANIVGVGFQGA